MTIKTLEHIHNLLLNEVNHKLQNREMYKLRVNKMYDSDMHQFEIEKTKDWKDYEEAGDSYWKAKQVLDDFESEEW